VLTIHTAPAKVLLIDLPLNVTLLYANNVTVLPLIFELELSSIEPGVYKPIVPLVPALINAESLRKIPFVAYIIRLPPVIVYGEYILKDPLTYIVTVFPSGIA